MGKGQQERGARGVPRAARRERAGECGEGRSKCAPDSYRWRSMSARGYVYMGVYTVVFECLCKKAQPYTILHIVLGADYRPLEGRGSLEDRGSRGYFTWAGGAFSALVGTVK